MGKLKHPKGQRSLLRLGVVSGCLGHVWATISEGLGLGDQKGQWMKREEGENVQQLRSCFPATVIVNPKGKREALLGIVSMPESPG